VTINLHHNAAWQDAQARFIDPATGDCDLDLIARLRAAYEMYLLEAAAERATLNAGGAA